MPPPEVLVRLAEMIAAWPVEITWAVRRAEAVAGGGERTDAAARAEAEEAPIMAADADPPPPTEANEELAKIDDEAKLALPINIFPMLPLTARGKIDTPPPPPPPPPLSP